MDKVKTISQLKKIKGKKVGLVTGVFDILHFEHVRFLEFAKKKVDVLIVGLESDDNVRIFKGKRRPIFRFKERASVLSALECVDFIFKVPEIKDKGSIADFYKDILKKVSPNILFSAVRADSSWKKKKKKAGELGIKFMVYDKNSTVSSSQIAYLLLK